MYGFEELTDGPRSQRIDTAFAWLATAFHELINHMRSIEKNRPRRAGLPKQFGPGGDSRRVTGCKSCRLRVLGIRGKGRRIVDKQGQADTTFQCKTVNAVILCRRLTVG